MRDVSQSITRIPVSKTTSDGKHLAPTQLPRAITWIEPPVNMPRLQLGRESLMLQGFPVASASGLVARTSESLMQDLAGNMMALPVVLAFVMAMFASGSWREDVVDEIPVATAEEQNDAMDAFASLGL